MISGHKKKKPTQMLQIYNRTIERTGWKSTNKNPVESTLGVHGNSKKDQNKLYRETLIYDRGKWYYEFKCKSTNMSSRYTFMVDP